MTSDSNRKEKIIKTSSRRVRRAPHSGITYDRSKQFYKSQQILRASLRDSVIAVKMAASQQELYLTEVFKMKNTLVLRG